MNNNVLLGVDIGTTTVSFAVLQDGEQIFSDTVPNRYATTDEMINRLIEKTDVLIDRYSVSSIGLTGQMHGILCVNKDGTAVSDFYNWQTRVCESKTDCGITYSEEIKARCGEAVPCGYGLSTLYYLKSNGIVPAEDYKICTIADYFGMRLTGNIEPVLHASNAASLGLFEIAECSFKNDKIELLGISASVLPKVVTSPCFLGTHKGIPVSVAIGDNQASVFAALGNDFKNVLCINSGTGAQVSMVSDVPAAAEEVRPYLSDNYLLCGSAICGGSAFATVADFFRKTLAEFGFECDNVYAVMDRLAKEGADGNESEINVCTSFSGTRENADARGSISGISTENFTPRAMVCGTLRGMAEELYSLFGTFGVKDVSKIVGAGNGIRKNPSFCKILEECFGKEIEVCKYTEEAACGAATFSELCQK